MYLGQCFGAGQFFGWLHSGSGSLEPLPRRAAPAPTPAPFFTVRKKYKYTLDHKFKTGNFNCLFSIFSSTPSREHCRNSHCYLNHAGTAGSNTLIPLPTTRDTLACGITSQLSECVLSNHHRAYRSPIQSVLRIRSF